MTKPLSAYPAPHFAGVIQQKTERAAIAEIKNCQYDGATMIDLHMSCLENTDVDTLKRIISSTSLPVLALNYNSTYDKKDAGFDECSRADSFIRAVTAGAAGIDMQGYTFDIASKSTFMGEDKYSFTKNNPKEVVTDPEVISKQCDFIDKIHNMGGEVLLSCHPGIVMNAETVTELALFLQKRNPDIIKIVTKAETEYDMIESFRAMLLLKKEVKTPVSYHANGKAGMLSRVINPALGGKIAFCVDRYCESSTFEQIDLKTARSVIDGLKIINGGQL